MAARGFRHVLVPHDFSVDADRALAVALDLARRHRARVTVLHVASPIALRSGFPPTITLNPPSAAALAGLGRRLDRTVARARRGRSPAVATRVTVGDPHDQILRALRGVDLVVMGTQGLTGVPHLLVGSVAEKVVRHAHVPVMTVRTRRRRR
jgi:nucleotide-binding universal stress UspA family protein